MHYPSRRLTLPQLMLFAAALGLWGCAAEPGATDSGAPAGDAAGQQDSAGASCTSDKDCPGRVCDPLNRRCVACLLDRDCSSGEHCRSYSCEPYTSCKSSLDCVGVKGKPICSVADGECVACDSAADCGKQADCVGHKCVPYTPCTSSKSCTAQVCDVQRGRCVDCLADNDCAKGERCIGATCVKVTPCASDKDCTPLGKLCDKAAGICRRCLTHDHCPAVYHCTAGDCVLDICAAGQSRCVQNAVAACNAAGDAWTAGTSCGDQRCQQAAGKAQCVPWTCTPPCTGATDTCVKGTCMCGAGPACSGTSDTCSKGACRCGQGAPCTPPHVCQAGKCITCSKDADCDDKLSCTKDTCSGGACSSAIMSGSCLIAKACRASGAINPADKCQRCDPATSATAWSPVPGCGKCGDGKVNGTEACDGTDLGGATCGSLGKGTGTLTCKPDCTLDTSGCVHCGDGKAAGSEACDGADLRGKSCASLGYPSGSLKCSPSCTFDTSGCTAKATWAVGAGGKDYDEALAVALDSAGNVLVAGFFKDKADIGGVTLTASGGRDGFLAKLDPSGTVLWAIQLGGSKDDRVNAVAVDSAGNAYVAGQFTGTATFGSVTLTMAGGYDAFVAKVSGAGKVLWAVAMGGSSADQAKGIALDAAGNIYLTGEFSGGVTFGSVKLTSKAYADAFVVKLDGTGKPLWGASAGSGDFDQGFGVAVDGSGNVAFCGQYKGIATFGSTTLSVAGNTDAFVAKLDSGGKHLWARAVGGSGWDTATSVAVDSSGNVFAAGSFDGTASFSGTSSVTSNGSRDIFVSKWTSSGSLSWVATAGGTASDGAAAVALGAGGEAHLTGYFMGTAAFGSTSLVSASGTDVVAARLDAAGKITWATSGGSSGYDYPADLALDAAGKHYVAGRHGSLANFSATYLKSNGVDDIFIWKAGP